MVKPPDMPDAPDVADVPGGRRLPMFPLGTVLFPRMPLLLHVFEQRYRELVGDCLADDREFGVVLISRGSEVGGGDERTDVGTVAHIDEARPLDDGRFVLAARGTERIQVMTWLPDDPYPQAIVRVAAAADPQPTACSPDEVDTATSAVRRARALASELGQGSALPPDLVLAPQPEAALWQLCSIAPVSAFDSQRLLELDDPASRARLLTTLMDQLADDLARLLTQGDAET